LNASVGVRHPSHFRGVPFKRSLIACISRFESAAAGVLRRAPYQQRPLRHEYRLTERSKALYPVLVTLIDWANAHVPPPNEPSVAG